MGIEQSARFPEPLRRQSPQQLDNRLQLGRLARLVAEQSDERQVQRLADPPQQLDREIALAAFELGQIALRQSGIAREDLARHAPPGTLLAHPPAEAAQIIVAVGDGWRKGIRQGHLDRGYGDYNARDEPREENGGCRSRRHTTPLPT